MAESTQAEASIDNHTKQTRRYRPDIDGIRAFAVVAVIINHFNKALLPSGYLGVDIFFVISGYVITSSLVGRESKSFGHFLLGFYGRRIKRLVPALVVFVLITSVLISMVNPNPGVALWVGWRSLFGLSNLTLYKSSTDYFAESTELNPFTHTWSLGVEEQFYLFFPLLIWTSGFGRQTAKGARNLFAWLSVLTAVSLSSFIWLYQINQPAAYFLMPPRFWEMAAGSLIFIAIYKRTNIELALARVPSLPVVAAMLGVMFLPVSSAVPATITMVMLSVLLIISLKKGELAHQIFTAKSVVFIGLISYSLYLWHWTVLAISRWTLGIHWWSVPIQILVMLAAAVISYKWIETPIRKNAWGIKEVPTIVAGIGLLLVSATGLITFSKSPLCKNIFLGKRHADTAGMMERFKSGKITSARCYLVVEDISTMLKKCTEDFGSQSDTHTLWGIGDSHLLALLEGLRSTAQSENLRLQILARSATAFPQPKGHGQIRTIYRQVDQQAIANMRQMESLLAENAKRGDVVVIAIRYPFHFGKDRNTYEHKQGEFSYVNADTTAAMVKSKQDFFRLWTAEASHLSQRLAAKGVVLVFVSPVPEWQAAVIKSCRGQNEQWFNKLNTNECRAKKKALLEKYKDFNSVLAQLQKSNTNVHILNSLEALCGPEECSYLDAHGKSLYWDDDHLSDLAAITRIAPALKKIIRESDSRLGG
jgi:peptidoglycan/LPS O-acetylase OafA/YrhL